MVGMLIMGYELHDIYLNIPQLAISRLYNRLNNAQLYFDLTR